MDLRVAVLAFLAVHVFVAGTSALAQNAEQILAADRTWQIVTRSPMAGEPGRVIELKLASEAGWRTVFATPNGYLPSTIGVLWRRANDGAGPNIVVGGYTGGNNCCFELLSVNLKAMTPVQLISMGNTEQLSVKIVDGPPRFTVTFDIEAFNAPGALTIGVEIPMHWGDVRFVPDFAALVRPSPSADDLHVSLRTMSAELSRWRRPSYEGAGFDVDFAAPQTVRLLVALMLSGNSDTAADLLQRAWPKAVAGRELYWRHLSARVVGHRLWKELDLAKLPNAAQIVAGATQL